jgi:Arc/MetJ family transcription regulator
MTVRKKTDGRAQKSNTSRATLAKQQRLRIRIDDELLAEATQLTGASSTREVIEQSLQLLVRAKRQERQFRTRMFPKAIANA